MKKTRSLIVIGLYFMTLVTSCGLKNHQTGAKIRSSTVSFITEDKVLKVMINVTTIDGTQIDSVEVIDPSMKARLLAAEKLGLIDALRVDLFDKDPKSGAEKIYFTR